MKWPTWQQSAVAALISAVIATALARQRRASTRSAGFTEEFAVEFALISGLYSLWRIARYLPLKHNEGAIERARSIVDVQTAIGLPTELSVQRFILDHDWLGRPTTWYYAGLHVPALLAFLLWLFVRHRDQFPHWRNGLVFLTGCCLFIRFWRVAPPRFLVDLGYIDLSEVFGPSVYGPVGTGVSDQFAAMPSIHVGWAAVVSFGAVSASTSPWRWVVFSHVIITTLVVSATGHHWWLDGIVAIALLLVGLLADAAIRRRWPRRASAPASDTASASASERDATLDDDTDPVAQPVTGATQASPGSASSIS